MTQSEVIKNDIPDTLKLSILTAQLCQDKLAQDVLILDLRKIETAPTDFFVVCTCDSAPQMESLSNLILRTTESYHLTKPHIEGKETLEWVLIDYFDVVVHLMLKNVRDFYKLEKLWGDGEFYIVDDEAELHPIDFNDVQRIYG